MRIAYITDTFLPEINGVTTSIDAHARAMAMRGHDGLIICPRYRKPILHVIPRTHIKRYRSFSFLTNKETRIAVPSILAIARDLRRFRPDVVHVHTPLSVGVVGLATARMLRLPVIETYHTYIPDFMQYVEPHRLLRLDDLQDRVINSLVFARMFEATGSQWLGRLIAGDGGLVDEIMDATDAVIGTEGPAGPGQLSSLVAWQFTRALYNRAALVLTPSVTLKRELEANGVTVPVEYLSNGIDLSLIVPKTDYAATGRLIHAGRLGHEKNVDVVIRAFARVADRFPDITLDIVGDGPAREGLERLAARLGLAGRVRMRGFMDRHLLGRLYREYDLFVTASTIETQGIVLLEAMAAGLPVVGVDALALPELVQHERNGLIVAPGDEAAFGHAMARLLDDQAERSRFGAACREDVQAHALDAVAGRLERIYTETAAGAQNQRP